MCNHIGEDGTCAPPEEVEVTSNRTTTDGDGCKNTSGLGGSFLFLPLEKGRELFLRGERDITIVNFFFITYNIKYLKEKR